ncbi:MAG: hypothetical protein GY765_14435, partial [bacterium]|nr:hypothetical protein [bacterium]
PGAEDKEAAYSPKFLGYMKASYFFSKHISLALSGNYVGPMETYYDQSIALPVRQGNRTDGYFRLGANLRVRNLFSTGMFLNVRVSNILDEEYFYPTTSNNQIFAKDGTIGSGRSFLLTLGWKF